MINKNPLKSIEKKIKEIIPKINKNKTNIKNNELLKLNLNKLDYSKIIIFDTNFLMIPEQFKIDIFEQGRNLINTKKLGFMIFDKTIYELQKLSSKKGKDSISAKVALELINKNNINIINTTDNIYVDDMIVNYKNYLPNIESEVIIATQDKELKKRLKNKNINVLIMVNKSKLAIK
jgi:uncharacterized protein